MRYTISVACVAALLLVAAEPVAAQTGHDLFQQALVKERAEGDLRGAIQIYERIAREYAQDHALAAKALVQLGRCHEKLGSEEAQRVYRRVVQDYPDQAEMVQEARARLAALRAPAPVEGRGPVARRLLTDDDIPWWFFITAMPSPDGRRAAYIGLEPGREGRLFVRDLASGAEEQLLPGLPAAANWSPTWSPDGTRIAFMERAGGGSVESIKILHPASRTVTAVAGAEFPASGRALPALVLQGWSRDGRSIVYWYNPPNGYGAPAGRGELGIVPVDGGARRVLAEGTAGGGALSPDGRYVAYTDGAKGSEQVYVQAVGGGAPRRITSEPGGNRAPVWSPDGSAIAFFRRDGIWTVPVEGGETAVPRLAYASPGAFSWRTPVWTAAGGLYVVNAVEDGIPHRIAVDSATGAVTGALQRLPTHAVAGGGFAGPFRWSPDMQRTAFPTNLGDVVIFEANGASLVSHTVAPYETLLVLSWSGDGREVYCWYFAPDASPYDLASDTTSRVLAALDVSSGRLREIARWRGTGEGYVRSVSADARRILLMYHDEIEGIPAGLVVAEAGQAGGRLVAPARNADSLPLKDREQISPQGDQVIFVRSARPGRAGDESLWVVASDGNGLRRLATIKEIGAVLWDPSGRFITYTARDDAGSFMLRIVEVATGVERGSTRLAGELWDRMHLADWSRDGRFIGLSTYETRMEYWVVQGLLEGGR